MTNGVRNPSPSQASTVLGHDLDNPLPVDDCDRCSLPWRSCICDSRRPSRQPTDVEVERARHRSLSLEKIIAQLRDTVVTTKDAEGRPLCVCGVVLERTLFQCQACARRGDTERRQRALVERDQRWREEIQSWAPLRGVPEWEWARLDNPDFTRRVRFPRLLAYAQRYQPGHGCVLLSADTGDAKTSLTVAMLHRLRDAEVGKVLARAPGTPPTRTLAILRDLVWTTGFDLAQARRQTALGEGEARLVERAMSCRLLVLDEVGFEQQHDTVIQEIANARYVAEKPTIVTTGLRPAAFAKRYGDACHRRLTERGSVVEGW